MAENKPSEKLNDNVAATIGSFFLNVIISPPDWANNALSQMTKQAAHALKKNPSKR
jgi:hypothetical protein